MCHYTTVQHLEKIKSEGIPAYAWVTPTAYSACTAPYGLGLYGPKNIAVIVDTEKIPWLWGPSKAPAGVIPDIWHGQGIEYALSEEGAPLASIMHVLPLETCGDTLGSQVAKGGANEGVIVCKCGARH